MKNILVPTAFEPDTLKALIMSSNFRKEDEVHVTLLSVGAVPDSITELLFPSAWKKADPAKRDVVLENWAEYCKSTDSCDTKITEHHQQGMSRPVLKHLLERFQIDMVIVPYSFQRSGEYLHRMLLTLFDASETPLMLLPDCDDDHLDIHRALYIDKGDVLPHSLMQGLPFHVIHRSMVGSDPLKTILQNFKINLIVLNKSDRKESLTGFGLPVLTI
jgi:hypothetical protein